MKALRAVFAVAVLAAIAGAALASPSRDARAYSAQQTASARYVVRYMLKNRIGMPMTNYGFIGTNFTNGTSSFEYPLGSQHMHLVRGGIWVGGQTADENGVFVGVSTAAMDANAGADLQSPSAKVSEFSPLGDYIIARSALPKDQIFDRNATSEMDFISEFTDLPADPAREHRPLSVRVTQYNYEWSFSNYNHIIFFHYVIHNEGQRLQNVWVGMYDELASGNMYRVTTFPPSGWFKKKYIGWIPQDSMVTERYCEAPANFPANCHYDKVSDIVGVRFLGARRGNDLTPVQLNVTFDFWNWSPGARFLENDTLKYERMSSGLIANCVPLPDSLLPGTGDPVTLIAAGPFATIEAGDSVSVDFAYLAETPPVSDFNFIGDLQRRGDVAKHAFDLNYIVPVPPPSPTLKIVPRSNAMDLYFDDAPERSTDPTFPGPGGDHHDFEGYRIYLGDSRDTLALVGQYDIGTANGVNDTTGFNTTMDSLRVGGPWTIDGVTYPYRFTIDHLRNGYKYFTAITSYDVGTPEIESLESGLSQNEQVVVPMTSAAERSGTGVTVFPNPYRVEATWDRRQNARKHFLWFGNLPTRAKIHIYTLSGDPVYTTDFDGATYSGSNASGIYTPGSDLQPVMPGTLWGWDLITSQGQAAATGLYIWVVEDKNTGKRQTGKFLVIKSDREEL